MSDEGKPSLYDCKQAEDALKEWKQLHGQRSKLDLFSFSEMDTLRQDLPPDLKEPSNCFNCASSTITRLSPFTVTCSKYGISAGSSRVYVCGDWVDSCYSSGRQLYQKG
jgi:hypothetical protein